MKVIIREAAYADLERIHVIGRILDAIERLGIFPRLGREGRVPRTREWVVRGLPYIIVYTIDDERQELVIVAVFHGARNL